MIKVAVVGTGYVGLVTGVVLADLGNQVICVDNDAEKVEKLKQGIPPIYEPGIEEMLVRGSTEGHLSFTTDLIAATKESDIIFIAVGTPPGPDGPDLRYVKEVANALPAGINGYKIIVNKSTVPVGTGQMVTDLLVSKGIDESKFDVVSNPEFLREGTAIHDTLYPDRIVIGARKREAAAKLVELYAPLERPMYITDWQSAELIKYASNSFLAMKISFINAMSRICEAAGANVGDVAKGMGSDVRIGNQFLQAGLGWGGSCFPKDVAGLITVAESHGYDFQLLKWVVNINETQTPHFLERIEKRLGGFAGKRVGLLGLAFKANTDDIRDARSLVIIDYITERGGTVCGYDPVAKENVQKIRPDIEYASNAYDVAVGADALILVTEWNEFKQLDFKRIKDSMKQPILFDGRRMYRPEFVERSGLEYHTIGNRD